jgi:hypothetical protein
MRKPRVHRCKENLHQYDVAIRFDRINVEEWHWICEQLEYATRKPDRTGRARKTKVIVASHTMLIRFCPFCGKELRDL